MGAAEPTVLSKPRPSLEGLLRASRRLHLKYLLAAALPIYLNSMMNFLGRPWVWAVLLALLVATLFLVHRRSVSALLPGYFLFAQAWAVLWLLAPKAGMPLQVDYVIVADRVLGLGQLPTVWLQDRFHGLPAAEIFEVPIVAVYATFFLAHQIVLFALFFGNRRLAGRYAVALLTAAYLSVAVMTLVPTARPGWPRSRARPRRSRASRTKSCAGSTRAPSRRDTRPCASTRSPRCPRCTWPPRW